MLPAAEAIHAAPGELAGDASGCEELGAFRAALVESDSVKSALARARAQPARKLFSVIMSTDPFPLR